MEINLDGKLIGLVDKTCLEPSTIILSTKDVLYGGTLKPGGIYDKPWAYYGAKHLGNTSSMPGKVVTVTKEINVKSPDGKLVTWMEINLDGKLIGLVDKTCLEPSTIILSTKDVLYDGTLKSSGGIYDKPWAYYGAKHLGNTSSMLGQVVRVAKEINVKNPDGKLATWIEISSENKLIGLIDKECLAIK